MRLPDFILANTATILGEWDKFARSIWPAAAASPEDVRDHAEAILRAAAWDMKSSQTKLEQSDKSKGLRDEQAHGSTLNHASGEHALGRAALGFDLRAVMAEYRALRASVVRLWFESNPPPTATTWPTSRGFTSRWISRSRRRCIAIRSISTNRAKCFSAFSGTT